MTYFDEAGNSGDNLLDKDQPVYTLFSHDFTEDQCREIMAPLLSISNADELHFKNIKKYHNQREALLQCLRHPLVQSDHLFYYTAHKEFMIVALMVDYLFEHTAYKLGQDLYKRGQNIATANVIYIVSQHWNREYWKEILTCFIKWIRTAKTVDAKAFYQAARKLISSLARKDEEVFIGMMLMSEPDLEEIQDSFGKFIADPTLACFVAHCTNWGNKYDSSFDVLFDSSKQIGHWLELIDFFNNLPRREVGFGSRKHSYPLKIGKLETGDSKSSSPLQLADLFASSLNYYAINIARNISEPFTNGIEGTGLPNVPHNVMWPSDLITPEELDMTDESGTNPLDFIAAEVRKDRETFHKARHKGKPEKGQP